jgi:hypothetical protein
LGFAAETNDEIPTGKLALKMKGLRGNPRKVAILRTI